jgi:hypothetical protein
MAQVNAMDHTKRFQVGLELLRLWVIGCGGLWEKNLKNKIEMKRHRGLN